jgi:hypothetical protein
MGFLKKVLKVVAVVAAVALTISTGGAGGSVLAAFLGVSQVAATAVVAGLTIASSLLNKPKVPAVSNATLSRLSVSIDPRTPRKIVFGDTAMAADLRDYEYTGTDDEYVHYFIVNASHRITAHDEIWFDDKLAWTSAGGVQGEFVGYLTVATRTEGSAANAINISPRMGLTRRFTGLAYTHLRFKRTGNTKKAESPFAQSIPQRVTTIGRGIPCYDPRLDSTVTGGSGSHRVADQSTWAFTRNPALQLLTYLLGWRINGKLAVGKGMPVARVDLASFMAAANACDEPVALAAGGTEPRYRADGIFSEADDMGLVIDAYKTTMNAELDDSDGKLAIRVLLNDLDDPIADFGPDDFLSGLTWSPVADISDRFNVVRGQYTDARTTSLYQMIDYPEVLLASVDGIERSHNLPLPLVQSPSQAQRLAKQVLQRQQYSGTLEVTLGHTGWRVQKYDIVTITHPPLGFAAKLFRVASIGVGTHGQVQMTLREENVAIYAWDKDERPPVTPVAVTSYEYANNPIVQGIDDAGAFINVIGPSPSAVTVEWTWDGTLKDGQLPIEMLPVVERDGVDIRTDDSVSYSITAEGGLFGHVTVNNTPGDPDKGKMVVDDTVQASGSFSLTVTIDSIAYGPFRFDLTRQNDAPPSSNGIGGGTDNTLASVTSGTYAAMTGTHPADIALDVTVAGPGDTINLNASFEYRIPLAAAGGSPASGSVQAKGQYSSDGVTWIDMTGAAVTGSVASITFSGGTSTQTPGSLTGAWSITGLTAGVYHVRLVGRWATGSVTLAPLNGAATSSKV